MCGIHGVINKSNITLASMNNFMEQGFVVNTLRGTDSSGIFQIDRQHRKFLHKQMIPGFSFAETKTAQRFFKDVGNSLVTVGHVRAATHGKVTTDNAHPFIIDREDGTQLMGVHNGSIHNWRSFKDSGQYDVDSEWAFAQIAKDGIDALDKMNGAYCFIWWDEKEKDKLFMVRNDDRPMHFLLNSLKDAMLFGSEAGMLSWLAERNKIETGDMIYSLEPHMLYKFDLSKPGSQITWTKTHAPKFKVYTPPPVSNVQRKPGQWNAARARWEGGDDGENYSAPNAYDRDRVDDWTGYEDYLGHVNTGASGGSTHSSSFPRTAEAFCERFKGAVGVNRNRRWAAEAKAKAGVSPGDSTVGTETPSPSKSVELRPAPKAKLNKRERRRQKAAERFGKTANAAVAEDNGRAEMDAHGDYKLPPGWFSDVDATTVEKNQAKSIGVYGELQLFIGIAYEPQTGELIGEIEEYVPGEGKIKHPAIMRCHSSRSAQAIIDGKGTWTAIIGRLNDLTLKSYMFVVSELTDLGKEGMKRMAA